MSVILGIQEAEIRRLKDSPGKQFRDPKLKILKMAGK
jgi:hypothetical protein